MEMDDSMSGWKLSYTRTSHSIHFECKIFTPNISGCSAVVHAAQNSSRELILSVNTSVESVNDNVTVVHNLEVKIQNETESYYFAVFPVTSKGIIGSNARKGQSIPPNIGKTHVNCVHIYM